MTDPLQLTITLPEKSSDMVQLVSALNSVLDSFPGLRDEEKRRALVFVTDCQPPRRE